ncbi:hypothetical protein ACMZOO_18010 (plasmid) [Catenovulum sp. SX2]
MNLRVLANNKFNTQAKRVWYKMHTVTSGQYRSEIQLNFYLRK